MAESARLLMTIVALSAASPLAAQSAPSGPPAQVPAQAASSQDATAGGSDIVVTGKPAQKPTGNEVFDQARGISRVGPYESYVVALPRFWGPVCPGVAGLRTDYAEAMVDRMRETIARLKIALGKEGCSPNLVVAFANDGRSLLDDLSRERPEMFHLISQSEQAELLTDDAPVRVWNNITMIWTGAGPPPERGLKASVRGQLNRNAMPESYDIVSALVVFDRDAVAGLTLAQLADYATMRGLSHTRPATGGQPMATILSLFDPDGANPAELTDFDVGYLRSLYWWAPNASAASKFAGVQRWARKAARAPEAPKP